MILGILVIALGSFIPMGEFSRVMLVAGWVLIIVGSFRRMKYRR